MKYNEYDLGLDSGLIRTISTEYQLILILLTKC